MSDVGLQRYLAKDEAERLKGQKLFRRMLEDICSGTVFPAIRKEEVHFYYGGGRLFRYAKGRFYTNRRYLADDSKSVPSSEVAVPGDALDEIYARVKSACWKHWESNTAGEAQATSAFFQTFSVACENLPEQSPRLIDIECRFPAKPGSEVKQDKIDCLFMLPSGRLCFVEVKRTDDKRVLSTKEAEVVGQLKRYRAQLDGTGSKITEIYAVVMDILGLLLDRSMRAPTGSFDRVPLLLISPQGMKAPNTKGKDTWLKPRLEQASDWSPEQDIILIDGRDDPAKAMRTFLSDLDHRLG